MIINTGTPRSVSAHLLSGALMGFMVGGVYEYNKLKNAKDKKQAQNTAIKNTLKMTLEGGIVSACAIGAVNAISVSNKTPMQNILEASMFLGAGALGVYAISKTFNNNKKEEND
ncbi:hypothetical protein [Helicobacter burdigaliensis]|uniref:hypothetical protein n=1 Tax=Helicobacter burdigaliensis TaxID=2315334 RepID=UPI000EF6C239|nr:hypothetical protein [Helicobacter burdigaliensis]